MNITFRTESFSHKLKKHNIIIIGQCDESYYDNNITKNRINTITTVSSQSDIVKLFGKNNEIYDSYMHFYSRGIEEVLVLLTEKYKYKDSNGNIVIEYDKLKDNLKQCISIISGYNFRGLCIIAGYKIDENPEVSKSIINEISISDNHCIFMFSTRKLFYDNLNDVKNTLNSILEYKYDGTNHLNSVFIAANNVSKSIFEYNGIQYNFCPSSYIASFFLSEYPKNIYEVVLYFSECGVNCNDMPCAYFNKRSDNIIRVSNFKINKNSFYGIYAVNSAIADIEDKINEFDVLNHDVYEKISDILSSTFNEYSDVIKDYNFEIYYDIENLELIICLELYIFNTLNAIDVVLTKKT